MDKKPMGYKAGQTYFMDKKVRANPKYVDVKATLDTGMTVDKVSIVSNNQVTKRRGEIFNRINKNSLAKLISIEKYSESIYSLNTNNQIDLTSLKETEFHKDETHSKVSEMSSALSNGTRKTIMTVIIFYNNLG